MATVAHAAVIGRATFDQLLYHTAFVKTFSLCNLDNALAPGVLHSHFLSLTGLLSLGPTPLPRLVERHQSTELQRWLHLRTSRSYVGESSISPNFVDALHSMTTLLA